MVQVSVTSPTMVMWREIIMLLLFLLQQICATNEEENAIDCPTSSCGKIANISRPFRLKGDPLLCGDSRYELSCENNVTVLYLSGAKYYVQAINYHNFTIRVVDPGVEERSCSSLPRYFLSLSNFTDGNPDVPYQAFQNQFYEFGSDEKRMFKHIFYLNCRHQVGGNHKYVNTSPCVKWQSKGYMYAFAGDLTAADIEVGCRIQLVSPTSWWGLDANESSYTLMNRALFYGFEMSWFHFACDEQCGNSPDSSILKGFDCSFDSSILKLRCLPYCYDRSGQLVLCGIRIWSLVLPYLRYFLTNVWIVFFETIKRGDLKLDEAFYFQRVPFVIGRYVLPLFLVRFLLGVTLLILLLVYKWRKRHLSMYENIENYLEHNNLMPIRYSYKEIKKMVKGFKEKLGEGGYGSVFKGKLFSGSCVAIKMLGKSKGSGHDFISEVSTIGRIHHQNVVQLIGFCVEGSRRALVYEFMPNGSLDKIIFSKDRSVDFGYDKIYNISIGVARGIAYLHHGCEMQILHFDIKPHNILLDDKFIPKVSDFGLAKLYPIDNNTVTMTTVGGTIGYMAPELFYKNIGRISYKSDVYSFGMLLMEMASKRKNLNPHAKHSSQIYFPSWIYDHIREEKDIEMEDIKEEEKKIAKKMIIVAFWCIQMNPNDRPSMNKVVEMLEGDIEKLEIPPNFSLYPYEGTESSKQTIVSEFISSSMEID